MLNNAIAPFQYDEVQRQAIINSNFAVNQMAVSGTVILAAGAYGHDMWKAGASGCTYTFATTLNITTITITAGSLIQVVEGINLYSGTYTLSWIGTAQGKIGAGSYGATGITGTAVGGTNLSIEFNTGTLSKVQFNAGDAALLSQPKNYGDELLACARHCKVLKGFNRAAFNAGNTFTTAKYFDLPMRAAPTLDTTYLGTYLNSAGAPGANQWNLWYPQTAATITWGTAPSAIASDYSTTDMINLFISSGVTPSLGTVGAEYSARFGAGSMLVFSARL
jgi:hypothetical protein